ncbi:hypothetical protein BJX65DRAFT_282303 [Aspergillus insuetus]
MICRAAVRRKADVAPRSRMGVWRRFWQSSISAWFRGSSASVPQQPVAYAHESTRLAKIRGCDVPGTEGPLGNSPVGHKQARSWIKRDESVSKRRTVVPRKGLSRDH